VPRWVWAVWAAANVVGGAVLALPDDGPRLFSFSRTHGPSALDGVGAIMLLAGWIVLDGAVVARREAIRALGKRRIWLAAAVAVVGVAVLVPTIAFDLGWWWIAGVLMLAGAQVWLAIAVTRSEHSSAPVENEG